MKNVAKITLFLTLLNSLTLEAFIPRHLKKFSFLMSLAKHHKTLLQNVSMGCKIEVERLIKEVTIYGLNEKDYINTPDKTGRTALHYACLADRFEIAKMLLAHGANPWLTDERGNTPVHFAELTGNKELKDLIHWYSLNEYLSKQ